MDFISLISQVGFPIAVCVYLLYERSRYQVKIVTELTKISSVLNRLEERLT